MKAISLWQPWASAMALGLKRNETRSWETLVRGPIAIHAAKGFPQYARTFASEEKSFVRLPSFIPLGAIVATARLGRVEPTQN